MLLDGSACAARTRELMMVKSLAADVGQGVITVMDYASGAVLYQNLNSLHYMVGQRAGGPIEWGDASFPAHSCMCAGCLQLGSACRCFPWCGQGIGEAKLFPQTAAQLGKQVAVASPLCTYGTAEQRAYEQMGDSLLPLVIAGPGALR